MDAPLTKYDQIFLNACRNGKPIDFVLSLGANICAVDPKNGFTGLHYASDGGHIETVKHLLRDQDALTYTRLVNGQCKKGMSPFNYAFKKGYDAIGKMIMDYTLETLIRADMSSANFIPLAQTCIDVGADINANYGCRYFTPLLTMCAFYTEGDIEKIRFLLNAGAQVDLAINGMTPIFMAFACSGAIADAERLELIKLLIDYGADVNATGKNGCNLMHQAIMLDDIGLVNFLIEKEIILGVMDRFGQNEIHYAVMNLNENILKLLLDRDIPMISAIGEDGVWPLHAAVIRSNENIIKIVLEKMKELSIDINTLLDHEGKSPLHYAAEQGSFERVKALLDAGAKQFLDKNSMTPFQLSYDNKNEEVWSLLDGNSTDFIDHMRSSIQQKMHNIGIQQEKICINNAKKGKKTEKNNKNNKKRKKKKEIQRHETPAQHFEIETTQIIEKKPLDLSSLVQPEILDCVCELSNMCITSTAHKNKQDNAIETKAKKKSNINLTKPLSYTAAVMKGGFDLGAQTMRFMDAVGRLTELHIPAGSKPRDISFFGRYEKNAHVKRKEANASDLFHATSEEQMKLVLRHGELFDTRENGRIQCYRMLTTKEAIDKTHKGYMEISIDTQKKEIIHAFFNKKKENKTIAFS